MRLVITYVSEENLTRAVTDTPPPSSACLDTHHGERTGGENEQESYAWCHPSVDGRAKSVSSMGQPTAERQRERSSGNFVSYSRRIQQEGFTFVLRYLWQQVIQSKRIERANYTYFPLVLSLSLDVLIIARSPFRVRAALLSLSRVLSSPFRGVRKRTRTNNRYPSFSLSLSPVQLISTAEIRSGHHQHTPFAAPLFAQSICTSNLIIIVERRKKFDSPELAHYRE